MAVPGILRNLFEGRFEAADVEGLVTHVTEHDAFLVVVETTSLTTFAFEAFPLSDELIVQR